MTGQKLPIMGITRFRRDSGLAAPAPASPDGLTIQSDDYLMTGLGRGQKRSTKTDL